MFAFIHVLQRSPSHVFILNFSFIFISHIYFLSYFSNTLQIPHFHIKTTDDFRIVLYILFQYTVVFITLFVRHIMIYSFSHSYLQDLHLPQSLP